jgi:hypothetical protein
MINTSRFLVFLFPVPFLLFGCLDPGKDSHFEAKPEAVKTTITVADGAFMHFDPGAVEVNNNVGKVLEANVNKDALNVGKVVEINKDAILHEMIKTVIEKGGITSCGNIYLTISVIVPEKAVYIPITLPAIPPKAINMEIQTHLDKGALGGDIPWTLVIIITGLVVVIVILIFVWQITKRRSSAHKAKLRQLNNLPTELPTAMEKFLDLFC